MRNPVAHNRGIAAVGVTALAAALASAPSIGEASGTALRGDGASTSTSTPRRHAVAAGESSKQAPGASHVKVGSGVSVNARVDGAPAAGQPFAITLNFSGVSDPAGATVEVSADGGLQLSGATRATLPAGSGGSMALTATAPADGMYFLNVFTRQGTLAGATSVPVKVGSGQMSLEKRGQVKSMPSGERVISLPAK